MGGTNPYLEQDAPAPATQKFTITFLPMNVTVEVDPAKIPYGHTGLPGSILDIALAHGIDIDHACGGGAGVLVAAPSAARGAPPQRRGGITARARACHRPGANPRSAPGSTRIVKTSRIGPRDCTACSDSIRKTIKYQRKPFRRVFLRKTGSGLAK